MELVPLKNGKWLTVRAAEPGDAAAFMAFSRLVGGKRTILCSIPAAFSARLRKRRNI